ncbi:hypothetical protein QA860_07995 [Streptomyces stelliscabiei]|uniref:hypothetical protein n=1 Tax=Streptomyces stelliscabiei TaxID=146820 RepID=UPI002FEEA39C
MTTSLQTPTVEQLAWRVEQDARERNERAYRVTVDIQDLPSHVAYQATSEAVHVFATDMNVIADWLFVMDGSITKVDLPSGQTVWTLRTSTWSDSPVKFPPVPVHVTVTQVSGAPVMHEIAAAVTL